jgi:hypothetical protein
MLVAGASFSVRRMFPGRNGRNPLANTLPSVALSAPPAVTLQTKANILAFGTALFRTSPTCILPLIYEVF